MSESGRTESDRTSQQWGAAGRDMQGREAAASMHGTGENDGSTHRSSSSAQRSGENTGNGDAAPTDLGAIGQEAVSQAQEQAVKIVSQAREQVTASVKTQTTRGANIATVLSSTLHDAGSQLRDNDEATFATYLDQAADQVEHIGTMLDNQDYGQLIGTVQGFAKRQPVLFFAAAVAVGVVGARFLRSSASPGSTGQQLRGPDAYAGRDKLQGGDDRRVGGYA